MKKIKTLEIMKELINSSDVEFIPVEEANTIYVDYGCSQSNLESAYKTSNKIAKLFDSKVLFHFNGCDMLVSKNTKIEKVLKQYHKEQEVEFAVYVEKEFEKASKNLTIKNAKRKTREVRRLLNNESTKEYISSYQLNKLSKSLVDTYKSTLSDKYLDDMTEKAKTLLKK